MIPKLYLPAFMTPLASSWLLHLSYLSWESTKPTVEISSVSLSTTPESWCPMCGKFSRSFRKQCSLCWPKSSGFKPARLRKSQHGWRRIKWEISLSWMRDMRYAAYFPASGNSSPQDSVSVTHFGNKDSKNHPRHLAFSRKTLFITLSNSRLLVVPSLAC